MALQGPYSEFAHYLHNTTGRSVVVCRWDCSVARECDVLYRELLARIKKDSIDRTLSSVLLGSTAKALIVVFSDLAGKPEPSTGPLLEQARRDQWLVLTVLVSPSQDKRLVVAAGYEYLARINAIIFGERNISACVEQIISALAIVPEMPPRLTARQLFRRAYAAYSPSFLRRMFGTISVGLGTFMILRLLTDLESYAGGTVWLSAMALTPLILLLRAYKRQQMSGVIWLSGVMVVGVITMAIVAFGCVIAGIAIDDGFSGSKMSGGLQNGIFFVGPLCGAIGYYVARKFRAAREHSIDQRVPSHENYSARFACICGFVAGVALGYCAVAVRAEGKNAVHRPSAIEDLVGVGVLVVIIAACVCVHDLLSLVIDHRDEERHENRHSS